MGAFDLATKPQVGHPPRSLGSLRWPQRRCRHHPRRARSRRPVWRGSRTCAQGQSSRGPCQSSGV